MTWLKIETPIFVTWLSSWSCDTNKSILQSPGLASAEYLAALKG